MVEDSKFLEERLFTKVIFRMENVMAQGEQYQVQEKYTKECSWTMLWKAKASFIGQMVEFMKESTIMERDMDMVSSSGQTEMYMKENSSKTTVWALVYFITLMVVDMKETGRTERNMAREPTFIQVVKCILVYMQMEPKKLKENSLTLQQMLKKFRIITDLQQLSHNTLWTT